MHGIVGINEHLLKGSPEALGFVLAHEGVHLQVGDAMRLDAYRGFEDYISLFHETVLPAWMDGELDLRPDRKYLEDDKRWEDLLYPGSQMPDVTYELAVRGIRNFFEAFSRGNIRMTQYGMMHSSPGMFSWNTLMEQPKIPPRELYDSNPSDFAHFIATGFEFADDMFFKHRNFHSRAQQSDMLTVEENFANFVAARKLGITLPQAQRLANQDANKFPLAEQFEKLGLTDQEIDDVHSHEDLVAVYEKTRK
jgi:hypothetical protein